MRLLLVEDDDALRALIAAWFAAADIEIRSRAFADDATDGDIGWCTAVLADLMLPSGNGCHLLGRVAVLNPAARRVMWTANANAVTCPHAHVRLFKPTDMNALEDALRG